MKVVFIEYEGDISKNMKVSFVEYEVTFVEYEGSIHRIWR